jgi:hypothetical protein
MPTYILPEALRGMRNMKKLLGTIACAVAIFPVAAYAAAPTPHVRGTVTSIDGDTLTVRTYSGQVLPITLTGSTHYAEVKRSSLDAIDQNTYIGTATKTEGSKLIALEVVVFPNAMRGAGEGHYAWDALPDTTQGGHTKVASSMTNGTVTTEHSAGPKVASSMTNGTVAAAKGDAGEKQLTVTYKGGEQHILVPPTAPIVTLAPGSKADLSPGAAVFVAEGKTGNEALYVAVGVDGVKPPM